MNDSFSFRTKEDLTALRPKSRCCRKAYLYGMLFGGERGADAFSLTPEAAEEAGKVLSSLKDVKEERNQNGTFPVSILPGMLCEALTVPGAPIRFSDRTVFVCERCVSAFLRGVFLSCGTVTDPEKTYHLEFLTGDEQRTASLEAFLGETIGHPPKRLKRRGRNGVSLYFKDSTAMEDFLSYIGAQKAAFSIMNAKILKDIRNNANRHANCDAANIGKTVAAAQTQIDAIILIGDAGKADELPEELRETFDLRAANPDATLSELAAMHSQKISRSGVTHRLTKIVAFAKRLEATMNTTGTKD